MPADLSDEETSHPLKADALNFCKVEKWTKDGTKVDRMILCRQQPGQGAGGLRGGDLPSAAYPAHLPAEVARAGAVAGSAP
jgi:hypothetical protein